jgi:hypothetical protein
LFKPIFCFVQTDTRYRSINASTVRLAENVKGLMDASAASSALEFASLRNITTTFLDAFHELVIAAAAITMMMMMMMMMMMTMMMMTIMMMMMMVLVRMMIIICDDY